HVAGDHEVVAVYAVEDERDDPDREQGGAEDYELGVAGNCVPRSHHTGRGMLGAFHGVSLPGLSHRQRSSRRRHVLLPLEPCLDFRRAVEVFHYHLVTSRLRRVEERYLAKLGFRLIARYGRIGVDTRSFESGIAWDELDRIGFRLRLTELERGSVNVVVQPGQWDLPRVDHLGLVLDEDEFAGALARAIELGLRVQEHGGRRTFISTNAGFRLE